MDRINAGLRFAGVEIDSEGGCVVLNPLIVFIKGIFLSLLLRSLCLHPQPFAGLLSSHIFFQPWGKSLCDRWCMLECGCKVEEPNGKGVDGDGVFPKVSPRDAVE